MDLVEVLLLLKLTNFTVKERNGSLRITTRWLVKSKEIITY